MVKTKSRPNRVKKDTKGYYVVIKGKKVYIKGDIKDKKSLVNVIIKNYNTQLQNKQKAKRVQKPKKTNATSNASSVNQSENYLKYTLLNKQDQVNIEHSKELQELIKKIKVLEDRKIPNVPKEKVEKIEKPLDPSMETITENWKALFKKNHGRDPTQKEIIANFKKKESSSSSSSSSPPSSASKIPITSKIKKGDKDKKEEDETPDNQTGEGNINDGLTTNEITQICKDIPNFSCIPNDQLLLLKPKNLMNIIINTDPADKQGQHWCALRIDTEKDKSVEYYDSYGNKPSKRIMKDLKKLICQLNPSEYLKLKINNVVEQYNDSATCGWLCIKFLMDREKGINFMDATKYTNKKHIENSENQAVKLANKFGFI